MTRRTHRGRRRRPRAIPLALLACLTLAGAVLATGTGLGHRSDQGLTATNAAATRSAPPWWWQWWKRYQPKPTPTSTTPAAPKPTPTVTAAPKPTAAPTTAAPAPMPTTAPTSSAPTPAGHTLLGVYVGNDSAAVGQFESWLGRPVDGILGYTGNASWADYDGSVGYATGLWKPNNRPVFWSVPLIPTGANLADAATGTYNSHYEKAAAQLLAFRSDAKIYVRTGWEFNGDWFPWKVAPGQEKQFAGAFQQFVTSFRNVEAKQGTHRFVFEWNTNIGKVGAGVDPAAAYPGDDYVDIVGMDFYWNPQWDPTDPAAAWNSMLTRQYGLQWQASFAAAHGKPLAYSEWGVKSDNAGPYIQNVKKWFDSHDVVYQTYWDSNNAYQGDLSHGQYPNAGAAYRAAFGG